VIRLNERLANGGATAAGPGDDDPTDGDAAEVTPRPRRPTAA